MIYLVRNIPVYINVSMYVLSILSGIQHIVHRVIYRYFCSKREKLLHFTCITYFKIHLKKGLQYLFLFGRMHSAPNVKVKFTNTAPSTFINRENNEDFWNTEIGSVMKVVKCCYNSSIQFC